MPRAPVVVLAPVVLLALSTEALARPAEAGSGEPVARVLLVHGDVEVQAANGHRFPAEVDTTLLESDTLEAGWDAYAILHLQNDHVVRLDEDLRLPVSKIAALQSPKARQPVKKQLSLLLYPEERTQDPAGVQRAERTAAWHARLASGDTVPSEPTKARAKKSAEKGAERRLSLDADSRTPPPPPPPPRSPPAPAPKRAAESEKKEEAPGPAARSALGESPEGYGGRGGGVASSTAGRSAEPAALEDRVSDEPAEPMGDADVAPVALRWKELPANRRKLLRRCLADAGVRPAQGYELQVRLKKGRIHRIRRPDAAVVPSCVRRRLLDTRLKGLPDGRWIPLSVPARK